jgi:hypothetical protein
MLYQINTTTDFAVYQQALSTLQWVKELNVSYANLVWSQSDTLQRIFELQNNLSPAVLDQIQSIRASEQTQNTLVNQAQNNQVTFNGHPVDISTGAGYLYFSDRYNQISAEIDAKILTIENPVSIHCLVL